MTDTLPGLLAAHAERNPRGVALRQKRLGIWREISWSAYLEGVRAVADGLAGAGLRPGDVVALIGGHRVQWLEAELGVQAAGAAVAPMIDESAPAELAALLRNCSARFAVVEGQEQVDKLLGVRERLPALELVLYWDPRGMRTYTDAWLRPLAQVTGREAQAFDRPGRRLAGQPSPSSKEREAVAGSRPPAGEDPAGRAPPQPDTVAEIVYSPGLGGAPRGVRLTHANLIAAARAVVAAEGLDGSSEFVCFAPQGWIGDRIFATAAALVAGYTVNLPEEPETVPQDIQEIGPRLLVAPPLLWDRLYAAARMRGEASGRLRRALYRGALGGGGLRLPGPLAELLVRRPVRDHLGLLRLRHAYAAGAPLSEETGRFFRAIGVTLKQMYLVTAAGGPVATGTANVGRALPGVELQVAADGEVLVRGPSLAAAYQGSDQPVTAPDGVLHTGDFGRMEPDGTLTLVGRTADVACLADGTRVLPAEIERRLGASPYVRHAVALVEGRPYVGSLLAIDPATVGAWAEHRGMPVTTLHELSRHPQVSELLRGVVQAANADLPPALRVQRFALLDRELSADDGELTRLRTVRRAAVLERWSALVDTLYGARAASDEGPSVITVDERPAAREPVG